MDQSGGGKSASSVPPYGSQEYWEQRYRKTKPSTTDSNDDIEEKEDTHRKQAGGDENPAVSGDPAPFHSWYFSYDDLRPIILPLILGGREQMDNTLAVTENDEDPGENDEASVNVAEAKIQLKEVVEKTDDETTEKAGGQTHVANEAAACKAGSAQERESKENNQQENVENDGEEDNADDDDDNDEWEECVDESGGDNEEEEPEVSQLESTGLAVDGPISVLEIGCGDVPLGSGLAEELKKMEAMTGADAQQICNQILCTDYSPTVIEMMTRGHQKKRKRLLTRGSDEAQSDEARKGHTSGGSKSSDGETKGGEEIEPFPIEFKVADARELPFQDRSFHLIFEKGTMDAMISDPDVGVQNCIKIVSDSARVLAIGGCFFLVSHINAHTRKGHEWLEKVVLVGLRKCGSDVGWKIEVHGSEPACDDDDDEPPEAPGPAVYLIFKRELEKEEKQRDDRPTIPLQFFSY